jgi:hypothetical protein
MRLLIIVLSGLFLVGLVSGCSTLGEGSRCLLGVSTSEVEAARKDALVTTVSLDYDSAFAKTEEALKSMKAYIYVKNPQKKMIAAYASEEDTTPVGIFFKQNDSNSTQIEVSSPSSAIKEAIAQKLFALLLQEQPQQ